MISSETSNQCTTLRSAGPEAHWTISNRRKANPMFGIIRLEFEAQFGRSVDGTVARLRFSGHEVTLPIETLLSPTSPGGNGIRVHLVTHLVPDGVNCLTGELIWPDGEIFRLPEAAYHIENTGNLAQLVREDLQRFGTPAILGAILDSSLFPPQEGMQARAWFNDPGLECDVPLSFEPASDSAFAFKHLMRWGFAVMDFTIDRILVDQFRSEYESAIDNGTLAYTRGTSERVHNAHSLPSGRKIWLDERVMRFLQEWFRDEPCACQTLLYIHGSTQHAHQDTIHLTPYPAGFMCGVWVALQDVEQDSGELFVLPGSHRAPRVMTSDLELAKVVDDYSAYHKFDKKIDELIANNNYSVEYYRPKAGQILVWHENLMHGGAPRINPDRERHSIVSHYFARGALAYYDSRGEAASLERVE